MECVREGRLVIGKESRDVFTCEYVFKHVVHKSTLTKSLDHRYKRPPLTRERRKALNFVQPQTKTQWAKSNFIYRSVLLWNDIPNSIQSSNSTTEFSRELRQHMLKQRNDAFVYT